MSNLLEVSLETLQAHPQNDSLYRDAENRTEQEVEELRASLEAYGVWEGQIVVHPSLTILCGHRRVALAKTLGIKTVTATVARHLPEDVNDPEVLQFLLNGNSSRQKTNEEKLREFEMRKAVESKLAKRRMASASSRSGQSARGSEKGDARDIASRKSGLGACGSKAEKASKALKTADDLREKGKVEEADSIVTSLNKSLNAGVKQAERLTAQDVEVIKKTETFRKTPAVKNPAVIDGVTYRSMERARTYPEFESELDYLKKEMPAMIKKVEAAERHLRKVMQHYNDKFVHDRDWPGYMTAIAQAWKEDDKYDFRAEMDRLKSQIGCIGGAYNALVNVTHDADVKVITS